MAKVFSTDAERDAFLAEPRQAILITNRAGEAPIGVPVWFEWTGSEVVMFSGRGVPKLERIKKDPNVMMLVTNHIGEAEAWVSFEGPMVICDEEDAWPLVERLAAHYWDVEEKKDVLEQWQAASEMMVVLRMTPTRIRNGQ